MGEGGTYPKIRFPHPCPQSAHTLFHSIIHIPWIPEDDTMADASTPLTAEHVRFYRENGYVVVPNFLSPAELADIAAAVDDAYDKHYSTEHDSVGSNPAYDAVFLQKVNLWQVHDGIRRHTFSSRLAACARQLMDAKAVRVWHDQTLVKEPNSLPTPFHQDLPYWPMMEDTALTAWTALDDVDERNSCMQYISGSQAWGRFSGVDFTSPQGVAAIVPEHAAECVPVSAPVPAGSVAFHHCLTFHGATANVTDKRRRAMIVHYMADGTRFNGQEHIVSKIKPMNPGEPMVDDTLWPVCG